MSKDDWLILGVVAVAYFIYSKGASTANPTATSSTGANPGVACVDGSGNVSIVPMGPCGPGTVQLGIG